MALVRRQPAPAADRPAEPVRDMAGLVAGLADERPSARRAAALDLSGVPAATEALLAALGREEHHVVRDAVVTALVEIGGAHVARGLVPFLASDDAPLRSAVVEALAQIPATAAIVPDLLAAADRDVRILTVMVLDAMRDERVPAWLEALVTEDPDARVVGAALDVLAEVGDVGACDAIDAVPGRFPDDPYLRFAAAAALERLRSARS